MRRAVLAAVFLTLSAAGSAHAQSISVFSYTTIVAGQRAMSECGTMMNDLQVQNNYPGVDAWCTWLRGSTPVAEWQCPVGRPTSRCSNTFSTTAGTVYKTNGDHGIYFPQVLGCSGYWDAYRFGLYLTENVPSFSPAGVLPARSPGECWRDPSGLIAYTYGTLTETFYIVPAQADIPPGGYVIFAGTGGQTPRCRLVSGPGTVDTANCRYNAPTTVSGTATAVVEGCNVNNPVDCANATITIRGATVTVAPGSQEVIPGTASIPLKATVSPSSFPQTVTWSLSPTNVGNLDNVNANPVVYTAPPNDTLPGFVRVTATACSTAQPSACGSATIDVPRVLVTLTCNSPFLATPGATQTFGASVSGPAGSYEVDWTPGTIVSIGFNTGRYTAPTPAITASQTIPVKACMKKNGNICGTCDFTVVAPVTITSAGNWQAGMTNNITITGTGFGESPEVVLSNPAITYTLGARSNTSIALQAYVPVSLGGQVLTVTVRNPSTGLSPTPSASANVPINRATLGITPSSASVREGGSVTFNTTCTAGGAACTGVSPPAWTANPNIGTLFANGTSATYTAPSSVASTTTVTISACWAAGQCASAPVTITPITVTVTPNPVNINGCSTQRFTAQVQNASVITVTWPQPSVGAIDSTGLYTAPCPVTIQTQVPIKACSTENPQKCGTATATLVPISVTVNPPSVSVPVGGSAQFSAVVQGTTNTGVTWSISPNEPAAGSIDQNGLYRAPSSITTVTSVTVKATSKADNTTTGTATVTLVVATAVLNPSSLTFAAQDLNTTSAAQAVTLSNTGTAAFSISSIVASGEFLQSNNCGTSVAPGGSCTINVQFRPTALGTRSGTLAVATNAPGSPHTVTLTGTGRGPTASMSPNSLDFGGQRAGFSTATQRVTLSNSGNGAMSISGITASTDFTQTNNCGTSVAAGASCFIDVAFSPAASSSGLRTGILQVTTNAPGSPHTSTLSGRVLGGFHDYNNCDGATGWAWDSSLPNTSINVYVFEGSTLLATVPANKYRADLPGNKLHAFDWMLPGSMRDGAQHVITIRFSPSPTAVPIPGSPKSLQCAPEPNFQGYHDTATCDGVTGWAWDASQPYTPITVYFFEGTQPLGSMLADMHRQDLANAGIGDGRHAFVWPIPAGLRNGQPHNITVLFENSWAGAALTGSPQSITCGGPDGSPCGGDGHHTWQNNQCLCTDCGSAVCCGSTGNSYCDGRQIQDPNTGYTGACASSLPACGPWNDFSGDDELYHDGDIFGCVKHDGVHEWFPRRPSPRCQEAGSTCTYLCAYNLAGGAGFMCESGGWWSQNPPLPYCYGGTVPEEFKCN